MQLKKSLKERRPIMVSVTMETTGTMLVGSDISAVLTILQPYPIDILGLNCATGPDRMAAYPLPVGSLPVVLASQCWAARKCWRSCPLSTDADGTADGADAFVEDLGVQVAAVAVHDPTTFNNWQKLPKP